MCSSSGLKSRQLARILPTYSGRTEFIPVNGEWTSSEPLPNDNLRIHAARTRCGSVSPGANLTSTSVSDGSSIFDGTSLQQSSRPNDSLNAAHISLQASGLLVLCRVTNHI